MSVYRVVVDGRVDPRFAGAFAGMTMSHQATTTALEGPVRDQAELQGLLQRLAGLGVSLVSVGLVGGAADGAGETPLSGGRGSPG